MPKEKSLKQGVDNELFMAVQVTCRQAKKGLIRFVVAAVGKVSLGVVVG